MMNKIIVIGCSGSGKTTFSLRLHELSGIPLFHLDAIWHRADRTHVSRDEFDARLGEILALDRWIIDGNYSRTLERRLAACDTVVLFDLPQEIALSGAIARLGMKRCDMPWVDTELDPGLRCEIESFGEKQLPVIYELIDKYRDGKTVYIFKSREEAQRLLESLER